MRSGSNAAPHLYDAGTGSGILAVTLAAEVARALVLAVDVSTAALAVAERNARAHGVAARVRFLACDLRAPLPAAAPFDGIVANLPYVREHALLAAPDPTSFEPRLALDGGPDGLGLYRPFVAHARQALAHAGWLFMEAGPDTVPALAALARDAFGERADVTTVRDYAGLERIVTVRT